MRTSTFSKLTLAGYLLAPVAASASDWPFHAGNSSRNSSFPDGPVSISKVRWSVALAADEELVYQSSPVAHDGRVFVNTRCYDDNVHDRNAIVAIRAGDGERLWSARIEPDTLDSWSSPAVDVRNDTVLIASDDRAYAFHCSSGAAAWERRLDRPVVNASFVVSDDIDNAGVPANRAFITDYTGFGPNATLYALNVDPFHPVLNPFAPGEIAWVAPLPRASGNSPAYADGAVYVASPDASVSAFDALDGSAMWQTPLDVSGFPPLTGFYGGLTVFEGHVYAATYVFYGGRNAGEVVKLDATTGAVRWRAACERTQSIPVVSEEGIILLSAGIDGFGSAVTVQAFVDIGSSALRIWDSHADTGGGLRVGGWTHQPAYSAGLLYVGSPDLGQFFEPYTDLYVVDIGLLPSAPGFIVSHFSGAGGSPAATGSAVCSIGEGGLFALNGPRSGRPRVPAVSHDDAMRVEP